MLSNKSDWQELLESTVWFDIEEHLKARLDEFNEFLQETDNRREWLKAKGAREAIMQFLELPSILQEEAKEEYDYERLEEGRLNGGTAERESYEEGDYGDSFNGEATEGEGSIGDFREEVPNSNW